MKLINISRRLLEFEFGVQDGKRWKRRRLVSFRQAPLEPNWALLRCFRQTDRSVACLPAWLLFVRRLWELAIMLGEEEGSPRCRTLLSLFPTWRGLTGNWDQRARERHLLSFIHLPALHPISTPSSSSPASALWRDKLYYWRKRVGMTRFIDLLSSFSVCLLILVKRSSIGDILTKRGDGRDQWPSRVEPSRAGG